MKTPNVFKRREIKYLITDLQKEALMRFVLQNMHPDEFGKSTIRNVYFDTPDFKLISNSLEHPLYKEKLRLRTYGKANQSTPAFVEIKRSITELFINAVCKCRWLRQMIFWAAECLWIEIKSQMKLNFPSPLSLAYASGADNLQQRSLF